MPFQVIEQPNGKYRLFNLHKKQYAKPLFNSKQTAISAGQNFMRYRGEKSKVVGNKILKIV